MLFAQLCLLAHKHVYAYMHARQLVSVSSGAMDLSSVLPPWVPQRHRVWHVLQAVDACMINPAPVAGDGHAAANGDANEALQSDPRYVRSRLCVRDHSESSIFDGNTPRTQALSCAGDAVRVRGQSGDGGRAQRLY